MVGWRWRERERERDPDGHGLEHRARMQETWFQVVSPQTQQDTKLTIERSVQCVHFAGQNHGPFMIFLCLFISAAILKSHFGKNELRSGFDTQLICSTITQNHMMGGVLYEIY